MDRPQAEAASTTTKTNQVSKGDVLLRTEAALVVPLFVDHDDDELPADVVVWQHATTNNKPPPVHKLPADISAYVQKLLSSTNLLSLSSPEKYVATCLVVVALHAVTLREWSALSKTHNDDDDVAPLPLDSHNDNQQDELYALQTLAQSTWQDLLEDLAKNSAKQEEDAKMLYLTTSRHEWMQLVQTVARQCFWTTLPHPLHTYAQDVVPRLEPHQWQAIAQTVLKQPQSNMPKSVLSVVKDLQDRHPPRPWAVLLQDYHHPNLVQDCFPMADIVLDSVNPHHYVTLVANYNNLSRIPSSAPLYLLHDGRRHHHQHQHPSCWGVDQWACRADTLEDRVRKMRGAMPPSACVCDRCRYEMAATRHGDDAQQQQHQALAVVDHDVDRILRLGHGYMALGDLDRAQVLYEKVREMSSSSSSCADAWHALGAIALARGKFLQAQRTWKSAQTALVTTTSKNTDSNINQNTSHAGLELQWAKLKSYRYLDRHVLPNTSNLPQYTQMAPNAFVAHVLTPDMCDQIVQWAHTGTWTQKRHYAVPTCDVPVHQVPPLLSWFNQFMSDTMCPLLEQQFETSSRYFVHDAFVVKYTAGERSNHLPIHTDESTHSFVLALNDNYVGGGTYFYESDATVKLKQGEILTFRGDSMAHGGEAVTVGNRLIVAAFLYHDDDHDENETDDGQTHMAEQVAKHTSKKRQLPFAEDSQETKEAKTSFSFGFQIPNT